MPTRESVDQGAPQPCSSLLIKCTSAQILGRRLGAMLGGPAETEPPKYRGSNRRLLSLYLRFPAADRCDADTGYCRHRCRRTEGALGKGWCAVRHGGAMQGVLGIGR